MFRSPSLREKLFYGKGKGAHVNVKTEKIKYLSVIILAAAACIVVIKLCGV